MESLKFNHWTLISNLQSFQSFGQSVRKSTHGLCINPSLSSEPQKSTPFFNVCFFTGFSSTNEMYSIPVETIKIVIVQAYFGRRNMKILLKNESTRFSNQNKYFFQFQNRMTFPKRVWNLCNDCQLDKILQIFIGSIIISNKYSGIQNATKVCRHHLFQFHQQNIPKNIATYWIHLVSHLLSDTPHYGTNPASIEKKKKWMSYLILH